ncbi:hypothetical protein INT47_002492 [Mucor saturninus]|uniref:Uncharacterized protein n=1 Tax=Mucor saturninus TaxID=64648 RepID=A0A8H7RHE3_9FUNG|nr:hypothetical protein INT47_002492 [Mucor saturninus]
MALSKRLVMSPWKIKMRLLSKGLMNELDYHAVINAEELYSRHPPQDGYKGCGKTLDCFDYTHPINSNCKTYHVSRKAEADHHDLAVKMMQSESTSSPVLVEVKKFENK